jgi:hypothetical protein
VNGGRCYKVTKKITRGGACVRYDKGGANGWTLWMVSGEMLNGTFLCNVRSHEKVGLSRLKGRKAK